MVYSPSSHYDTCSRSYYQGRSVCVYPGNRYECYPGFYKSRYNLDDHGIARFVRSARKGCFSSYVISPDGIRNTDSWFRSADVNAGGYAAIGDSSVFGRGKSPR